MNALSNFFKIPFEGRRGVALLLVMSIVAALASISFAMFSIVYSQLQISGDLGDSFIALYAADEGIEKYLYEDRVDPANFCQGTDLTTAPCSVDNSNADFTNSNAFSGGCYYALLTKTEYSGEPTLANNTLQVTGQSTCGNGISRFVRRAFDLTYVGPAPAP